MPKFCTQCGSPVGEDMQFCNTCGAKLQTPAPPAPAAAPAGPPPGVPAAAVAAAAPAVPVARAAPKPASPVLKIVLIIVGILIFIAVAGMVTCGYFLYRAKQKVEQAVKTEGARGSITLNTPQGKLRLGQRSASDQPVGNVPPYPGATPVGKGGEFTIPGKGQISSQEFVTSDPVDQVVQFYKDKLGPELSVAENEGRYRLALTKTVDGVTSVTTIDVSKDEDAGNTKIMIAYMGK